MQLINKLSNQTPSDPSDHDIITDGFGSDDRDRSSVLNLEQRDDEMMTNHQRCSGRRQKLLIKVTRWILRSKEISSFDWLFLTKWAGSVPE